MEGFSGSPDWSGLPRNVLFDITDNLTDLKDFIRFGDVCPSWRAIFLQSKKQACSNSSPFLYLDYPEHRAVYNPCKNRVQLLRLPLPSHYQVFCGSSFGWLVIMEDNTEHQHHVQLHNPFLNKSINLPPLYHIFQQPSSRRRQPFDFLRKAALSCDPSSANDFTVIGIMSNFCSLAFYKSGTKSWIPIQEMNLGREEITSFTDVIYFQKTKQFYVALSTGEVLAIDFVGGEIEPKLTRVAPPNRGFKDMVLVEDLSTGDLYQVNNEITSMDLRLITRFSKFNIFKLDIAEEKWKRVRTLGDKVLFFGYNSSMLCSASSCPGCEPNCVYFITNMKTGIPLCEPNCVYFIRYMETGMSRQYFEPPFAGIYNLQDDSIIRTLLSAIWLQPTLV